jgi:predicted ATPase
VRLREGLALTGRARDLPPRQQTINATIAWSYDLLGDSERLLLQRISVFSGGFTLAAAEFVCPIDGIDPNAVADLLASLVDKSLVNVSLAELNARYTMLDSMRSFALERLTHARQVALFSRQHAQWVAAFADRLDMIRAELPEASIYSEANPELENARSALAWALGEKSEEGALLAGRIVGGLRMLWIPFGQLSSARDGQRLPSTESMNRTIRGS